MALTSWTQQLSLCVNQTFSPSGLSLGRGWGKKKGGREGKEEGKMGGSVSLSRLSSQRPPGKEKREDKSLMTYAWVGSGGLRAPQVPQQPHLPTCCTPFPPLLLTLLLLLLLLLQSSPWGARLGARHPPVPHSPE